MYSDDEFGFWGDERDRSHVAGVPIVDRVTRSRRGADWRLTFRPTSAQPNPSIRRLGALFAIGLVAVPIAFVMRDTDPAERVETSSAEAAAPEVGAVPEVGADAVGVGPLAPATAPASAVETPEVAGPAVAVDTASRAGVSAPHAAVEIAATKVSCTVNYTVLPGDYWIAIARRGSIKLTDLLKVNAATVSTPLYPGRTICLPVGTVMPVVTSTSAPAARTTPSTTATTVKPATTAPTTTKPKATSTTATPTTAAPTTAAPTSTAAPITTVARPKNTYTRAQVEQIIRDIWPDDLEDEAVRIATRESNLDPTVRNSCCFGLFQIYFNVNRASLGAWGVTTPAELYDPQVNAFVAYAMYLRSGWVPWAL